MPASVTPTPRPDPQADFGRAVTPQEFARLASMAPQEAVAYMAAREQLAVTYSWRDLWQPEHARAFTVSRLTQADVLEDLRKGIAASVGGDLTRVDWMRDAQAVLQKAGWWGTKEVIDPDTGEVLKNRFDSRRLGLIFDTNTRTAHAAGQWERMQQTKRTFNVLRYVTQDDGRVRAAHMAWHNLVLPVDDPFWATHYPPNGWRCRCRVIPMRQKDLDKLVQAQQASPSVDPTKRLKTERPDMVWRDWLNAKTGQVQRVPMGIDPGWAYNVGQAGAQWRGVVEAARQKAQTYAARVGAANADVLNEMARRDWADWIDGAMNGKERNRLGWLGVISEADLLMLARQNVEPVTAEVMVRPGLVFGPKAKRHEAAGDALTPEQWRSLPRLFEQAVAVLLDVRSGKPLWVLPGDGRAPQLAMEVDFVTDKPKRTTNVVKSAYGVGVTELRQRLADGRVRLLRGSLA